jgi:hypothetical protein
MDTYLQQAISFEIWFFLMGLASITAYFLLTRKINTKKLFARNGKPRQIDIQKVQLLVITLFSAVSYLIQLRKDPTHFPEISELAWIVAGSNVIYLVDKFYSSLLSGSQRNFINNQK